MTEDEIQENITEAKSFVIAMAGIFVFGVMFGIGVCWFVRHIQFSWR